VYAVSNHDDAIERQTRLRVIPNDELFDRVFIDPPRVRRSETVQDGQFGVIKIGQTQDDATVVRLGFLATHSGTASGAVAMGFSRLRQYIGMLFYWLALQVIVVASLPFAPLGFVPTTKLETAEEVVELPIQE
jgi:hypothetical protein